MTASSIRWKGEALMDGALPFLLRSAPKLLQRWQMPLCGYSGVKEGRKKSTIRTTSSSSWGRQDQRSKQSP